MQGSALLKIIILKKNRNILKKIQLHQIYQTGEEIHNIIETFKNGKISGGGSFTDCIDKFLYKKYGFSKVYLTNSCTDALEMCAMLLNLNEGDEIIVPSFTFVSTALAFVREKAKVVFADCSSDVPCIDEKTLEALINHKTKAIVVMHYAGIACHMDEIRNICRKYGLALIEDAAHALGAFYKDSQGNVRALGTFADLSAFSFHQTKIITSGEGGMLCVENEFFRQRAEHLLEKGTNKLDYNRSKVPHYEWVDLGSSFVMSEIQAAVLWSQLKHIDQILQYRLKLWHLYEELLQLINDKGLLRIPKIPDYAQHNGSIFYILMQNKKQRDALQQFLKNYHIETAFHYLPLHRSKFYLTKHDYKPLPNTDMYADCLLRLPLHMSMNQSDVAYIVQCIVDFFNKNAML